ncbi:ParB/RepB/Spo0J family partition protein [Candidatus Uhrbacteria bacterium]|nr:ParB/RepB/Spo0J family partition protein [Candidatus Uhrbacteria bacterium]
MATLGRGLDALLIRKKTSSDTAPTGNGGVTEVPITSIDVNPHQPRRDFDEESLESLADSIAQHGILQPLVVTKQGERYELIAGERRLRAAQRAGLTTVPIVIRSADENTKVALALIENIQRVDLNPIELAVAYQRLLGEFQMTHAEIGKRLGKSRPVISNTIRFLSLPQAIQDALRDGRITEVIGRTILSLSTENERLAFFERVLEKKFSGREAQRDLDRTAVRPHSRKVRDTALLAKEEDLRERFGTKVTINKVGQHGTVSLAFYSEDEYRTLVQRLMEA